MWDTAPLFPDWTRASTVKDWMLEPGRTDGPLHARRYLLDQELRDPYPRPLCGLHIIRDPTPGFPRFPNSRSLIWTPYSTKSRWFQVRNIYSKVQILLLLIWIFFRLYAFFYHLSFDQYVSHIHVTSGSPLRQRRNFFIHSARISNH